MNTVIGKLKKYRVMILVLAALVAVYAAAGLWGVPRLLRSTVIDFTREHYGRSAAVGEIHFNPFTLALEVRELSLAGDAQDSRPMLSFGRLFVNLQASSLWRRGPSFAEITLERPFVRVLVRPDGTLNLADLMKPFDEPQEQDEAPARLFVDRLSVQGGEVALEDRTRATPFHAQLRPITFDLRDFGTVGGTDNRYRLTGLSAAGERFSWNGRFGLRPFSSEGQFEVAQLRAATVWSYLRESLAIASPSGVIDLSGNYRFTAADTVGLDIDLRQARIAGLGLKPQGADADYVKLGQLEVLDTRLSLADRSVRIGRVQLSGGEVRAWMDAAGRLNLLDLAGPAGGPSQTPAAATADNNAAWTFAAPDIGVSDLKVALEDRQVAPAARFAVGDLDVRIKGLSTAPGAQFDVTLDAAVGASGAVHAVAQLPLRADPLKARVEVKGFDLRTLQPYLAQDTALSLRSGTLAAALDIERAGEAIEIGGGTEVTGLRTVDNRLHEDFIKWERLKIADIHYRSKPSSLSIGSILARAPYARVIVAEDRTVNVARAFVRHATPPAKQDPPLAMKVAIGQVRFENGSANFTDLWIKPQFAVGIQGLQGTVAGLSSDARSRAKVALEGKVDRYAPVSIRGEINPLATDAYSDLKMSFKGLELTTVTPYSGHFAGYKIEKGKLSVDLGYRIERRELKADHRFVIDQLQLGERVESPDAVKLPVRLAVALLKDRNGVIDIDLPVTGSLDDPQFRVGPIVWKAVVNLLTKIATSPFKLLGSLVGGGEEMNLVDFAPGEAALDESARGKLASLLKALQERPQLQLEVPMAYAPDVDRAALALRELDVRLSALQRRESRTRRKAGESTAQAALTDPAERLRWLTALYGEQLGKQESLPPAVLALEKAGKGGEDAQALRTQALAELERALMARIEITDAQLEALGKQRAQSIQEVLLGEGGIDPSRLFVIGAVPGQSAGGKARLELSLK